MYVDDDSSTQDTTSTDTGHDGDEITVTVEGKDYEVEADQDVNHDGHDETAVVQTDGGHTVAFSDTDGDGHADLAVERNEQGNVEGAARYDQSTGEWVAVDPKTGDGGGSTTHTSDTGSGSAPSGHVTVEVDGRSADAGAATEDFDHDGKNDTVVVDGPDGTKVAYVDEDEDGDADVAIIGGADGNVTIVEETNDSGDWEVVETGHVGSDGHYERTSGGK
jgi:hypothetical protein